MIPVDSSEITVNSTSITFKTNTAYEKAYLIRAKLGTGVKLTKKINVKVEVLATVMATVLEKLNITNIVSIANEVLPLPVFDPILPSEITVYFKDEDVGNWTYDSSEVLHGGQQLKMTFSEIDSFV